MAKKSSSNGKSRKDPKLNTTNFKFIGAAFDMAIADLKLIKTNAKEAKNVDAMIAELEDLQAKTARVCPQNWYAVFELK